MTDANFIRSMIAELARIDRLEAAQAANPPKMISYAELVARHNAKRNAQ